MIPHPLTKTQATIHILIDASLIIGLANQDLEKIEMEASKKLLGLAKSEKFGLDIYLNSINKEEIWDPQNKALMELLEYIEEIDYRGCIGHSTIGTEPIGGPNTDEERQRFIDEFTNNFSSKPKKQESNKNDALQCHLAKMLNAECFLTQDYRTIINRHGSFLENEGVRVLPPSQFYEELLTIFPDLDSYIK